MSLKLGAALGFATRAGKLRGGAFTAEKLLKSGTAKLVVIDDCASEGTLKKWENSCEYYSVRLLRLNSPGRLVGKPDNKVFVVIDEGFANMIAQAAEESSDVNEK